MTKLSPEAYIAITYDIIALEGIDTVTIRYIAEKLNCSSASLYRHFDSLEQLIVFASLRFLRPYISEVANVANSNKYDLETYYYIWNVFINHAFEIPQIVSYVFFNKYKDMLANAVEVYYETLSDDISVIRPTIRPMLTGDNIYFRDRFLLKHCIDEGKFQPEEIEQASNMVIYIFKGMLNSLLDGDVNFDIKSGKKQFDYAMRLICQRFSQ